jgi:hypothetical protein
MLSSLRNTADNRELDAINKVRSSFYLNTLQGAHLKFASQNGPLRQLHPSRECAADSRGVGMLAAAKLRSLAESRSGAWFHRSGSR